MKDMTGRVIEVGDEVVYASDSRLTIGVVVAADEDQVKIERRIASGYFPVIDGVRTRNKYDKETKSYVMQAETPRPTTISRPSRCYIMKKGSQ